MAEAAVSVAVEKVGDLLFEKIRFVYGVERELNLLKDELVRMKCFLKDAGEKQAADERVRHWISEIRELAQDAEDVVEFFSLEVEAPRRARGLMAKLACFPIYLHRVNSIGEEISHINTRLKAIEASRQKFGIEPEEIRRLELHGESRRRLPPWEKDKHAVGLTEDVEVLLSKAVRPGMKKGRAVVAGIVGMGGAGKSTLARIVYNHREVVGGFNCRAWVVVSSEFSERDVIEEVVRQLLRWSDSKRKASEETEKLKTHELQHKLYQLLKGKRYFIVLDDIWENQHWESLKKAFPREGKGSVLLLTSRRQDILSGASYVHKMKALDSKESWKLFLNKAFIGESNSKPKCPNDLEKIGRQIVTKCEGLPLAITVAGGLLSNRKQEKSEWEEFLRRMNHYCLNTGAGKAASSILELSYLNLPAELKFCFLCFGFYKEDAVISAKRLLHIWVALGLIPGKGQDSIEDTARSYLDELISQNLVQVQETGEGERAKSLHIHDLLRDISIQKAVEEISFEILREEAGTSQHPDKPRHRVINCSGDSVGYSLKRNKRVRSLFYNGEGNVDNSSTYWRSFKLLRVLEFQGFGLRKLPNAVCEVSGLRYLGLRKNLLKKLPTSLGRLKKLEVLDISKNLFVEVPNVLYKMDSLRHLYMFRIKCRASLKIHTLKNVQTLSYVQLDGQLLHHLRHMTSLRKLGIELDKDTDATKLSSSLALSESLVSLSLRQLHGHRTMQLPEGLNGLGCITQLKLRGAFALPSFSSFPLNMSSLSLVGTWFEEDPMVELEKLPMLLYLRLDCAYNGEKLSISGNGFPKLEVLVLNGLGELKEIKVGKGGVLGLKRLEINECSNLKILPEKLRSISYLRDMS